MNIEPLPGDQIHIEPNATLEQALKICVQLDHVLGQVVPQLWALQGQVNRLQEQVNSLEERTKTIERRPQA